MPAAPHATSLHAASPPVSFASVAQDSLGPHTALPAVPQAAMSVGQNREALLSDPEIQVIHNFSQSATPVAHQYVRTVATYLLLEISSPYDATPERFVCVLPWI